MKKLIQTTAIIICVCMIMVFPASAADIETAVKNAQETVQNIAAAAVIIGAIIWAATIFIKRDMFKGVLILGAGGFVAYLISNISVITSISESLGNSWLK